MLNSFFIALVNISIAAGWAVIAVIIARLILSRAPKWIKCILWSIVAVRLLVPALPQSPLSLIPSINTIVINTAQNSTAPEDAVKQDITASENADKTAASDQAEVSNLQNHTSRESIPNPQDISPIDTQKNGLASADQDHYHISIESGLPAVNERTNDIIDGLFSSSEFAERPAAQTLVKTASIVWAAGCCLMILYAVTSALRLRRTLKASVTCEDDIYICDYINSPFIFGVLRPRIYIPSALSEKARACVTEHELAHIGRKDHLWKPLGFALLCIYWFNPLLWIAFILFSKDIELACDEKAVRAMTEPARAEYSRTLLLCSTPARLVSACPLAFGEGNVKGRVKAVLNYRKPSFWIIIAAMVLCAALAVALLTNPASGEKHLSSEPPQMSVIAENSITVQYSGSSWSNINRSGNGSTSITDSPGLGNEIFRAGLPSAGNYKGSCRLDFPVWPDEIEIKLISEDALNAAGLTEETPLQLNGEHELLADDIYTGTYYIAVHAVWEIKNGNGGYADYYFRLDLCADYTSSGTYQWYDHLKYHTDRMSYSVRLEEFPDTVFTYSEMCLTSQESQEARILINEGFFIENIYFSDVTGDGLRDICATVVFSTAGNTNYVIVYDYAKDSVYRLRDLGVTDYYLFMNGNDLCLGTTPYHDDPVQAGRLAVFNNDITMTPDSEILAFWEKYRDDGYLNQAVYDRNTRTANYLKEVYPWMFQINQAEGLKVYISSYIEGKYCCGILPGSAKAVPFSQASTTALSVTEVKNILAEYGLDDSMITLHPYDDPLSSIDYLKDEAEYKSRISTLFDGKYAVGETLPVLMDVDDD